MQAPQIQRLERGEGAIAFDSVGSGPLVLCVPGMGDLDPDFKNPSAEASWIASQLNATVLMVPDAGHYPQSQQPELVAPAIANFLSKTANA